MGDEHLGARRARAAVVAGVAVVCLAVGPGAEVAAAHATSDPATPADVGEHPWRYDGCTTGPVVRVNGIPGVYDFTHACIHHDGCYKGFPTTKRRRARPTRWLTRQQCDAEFLADMRASCDWQFGTDPAQAAALARCSGYAAIYYQAVRALGAHAYKGPKR